MSGSTASVPAYSHIVVVVEENHNFDEIVGNTAEAPFLNSLAADGAVLANFHATTHPSQPNYFALYAGSTFGTADDNTYSEPDPTLATILQTAGDTFTGYVDESDSDINHNPWESFPEGWSVQTDFGPTTSYPMFSSMFPSGNYSSLPSVSFVIPGIYNDMHNGTIQQGDAWLQANLAGYAQWAKDNNSLLVVVWDENDDESSNPTEAANQVPAIIYGAGVVPGTYTTDYNDYNLLSTVLGAFGLTGPNNAATASTIQVFGAETISTVTAGPLVLTAADNPLVVAGSGVISATGTGNDGIDGPAGTPWAIENDGTVSSAGGFGIKLASGGSVSNGQTSGIGASISGGLNGVAIYGAAGSVINAGSITGATYSGVVLGGSVTPFVYEYTAGSFNTVTNAAGASIAGVTSGVYVRSGTTGTITNSGNISASDGAGADLGGGGSVNNQSGSIAGSQFGVFITGGAGTIANTGSISGTAYDGIVLGAGGTVSNYAGASISGGTNGVYVKYRAAGTVTNSGTITGAGSDGLVLAVGGSVSNAAGGTITGAADGMMIVGGAGTVSNNGTISGSTVSGYGLILGAGGSITNAGIISGRDGLGIRDGGDLNNAAGGSIAGLGGSGTGVFIAGAPGTVTNAGSITGKHLGMLAVSGGTVTNTTSGSIAGASAGVFTNGVAATILNSGSISATGGAGLDIEGGGSVANNTGASISGSGWGVFVTGGTGSLVNSGSIAGGSNIGVLFEAGGSVTNNASASISGVSAGFFSNNVPVTLTNSGTIIASNEAAADLEGGGSVTNNAGATLSGGEFGAFVIGGTGTVVNAGSMAGARYEGVVLSDGGSITNSAGGSITGGSSGIYARSGALGIVTNSGSISGTASAGADIEGGGIVTNNSGASLSGGSFGVFITGGASTVVNAGTISGGSYAVNFAGSATNRLVVDPGAVFRGAVGGGGGTLELAAGAGSIGGINNGAFLHFQSVIDDSGGGWTLTGTDSVANLTANGTLAIAGSLDISTALDPASTGTFQLNSGAALEVAAATGTQTQMAFLGGSELLIDNAAAFGTNVGSPSYAGPQIDGFGVGDTIDLKTFAAAGATLNYNSSSGLLQIANGSGQVASLQFQASSLGSGTFHDSGDGASGLFITHS